MSWMDSWSRPSKSQATPPPFYLTQGDNAKYCHTCGRIIGARRANSSKASATEVKYCSDKCKRHKPSAAADSNNTRIENVLLALLQGRDADHVAGSSEAQFSSTARPKQKVKKGDPRIIVKISDIETAVFGNTKDPTKVFGRRKDRAPRGLPDPEIWKSVDMEDESGGVKLGSEGDESDGSIDDDAPQDGDMIRLSNHVRPAQSVSSVNGSIGGEKGWSERVDEPPEMLQKRLDGQKRAENLELVKNGARRAVVFGLLVDCPPESTKRSKSDRTGEQPTKVRRKCEALMDGNVVEPSFAKGDWSIRWRED